jgi:CheY-like chemotaxis protein
MSRDELMGRTLLVADDDPDILTIVSSVLEVNGYLVLRARDGNEAQRILTEALPDLAIFDLSMPGKSGLELCKSLRSQPGGELVPVMILTARDGIEDKVVAFGEGADEYVTKPFNSTELLARVRALLRIRLLSLSLCERNEELKEMQTRLVERERLLAVSQLAGAAAHNMGQPLSAILLNLHLMKQLPSDDERYQKALAAIGFDARRMVELLEQMKKADPQSVSEYFGSTAILQLSDESSEPVESSDNNVVQLRLRRERP